MQQPWLYYDHNVLGAINLVEVMRKHSVKNVSLLHLHRSAQWMIRSWVFDKCELCKPCEIDLLRRNWAWPDTHLRLM